MRETLRGRKSCFGENKICLLALDLIARISRFAKLRVPALESERETQRWIGLPSVHWVGSGPDLLHFGDGRVERAKPCVPQLHEGTIWRARNTREMRAETREQIAMNGNGEMLWPHKRVNNLFVTVIQTMRNMCLQSLAHNSTNKRSNKSKLTVL